MHRRFLFPSAAPLRMLSIIILLALGLVACQCTHPVRPPFRPIRTPTLPPVHVETRAVPTAIPILYARDDYEVYDYARHHPEYGPVGLWIRLRWNQIQKDWSTHANAFDWRPIDRLLARAARQRVRLPDGRLIPRPVILSISIYSQRGGDPFAFVTHTPEYLRRVVGDLWLGDPAVCRPQPAPPYHSRLYRDELKAFIQALGTRYDRHPMITAVIVGPGYDEETAATRLGVWCGNKLYSDYLYDQIGGSQVYAAFVLEMMDAYRKAFPHTALYLQAGNAEWPHRGLFVRHAAELNPPIGYKPNGLAAISGAAFGWRGTLRGNGWMQLAEAYQDILPIAFEPKVIPAYFATDQQAQEELYWMLLWGLAHNADFFDLQSNRLNPNLDWFHLLPSLDRAPHNFGGFVSFVNRNLGQDPSTAQEVWIVLRDVEPAEDKYGMGPWGPRNGYVGGEEGDWDHWLHRVPKYKDRTTRLLRSQLPAHPQAAQARQLRRTDDRYMWFRVDDNWRYFDKPSKAGGGEALYQLSVWYLDVGTDTWVLEYTRDDGSIASLRVQKQNSGEMRKASWVVEDARFAHLLEGADIRLDALEDGPEYIHMLHIRALHGPPSPSTPTPQPTQHIQPSPLQHRSFTQGVEGYTGYADTFVNRWFRYSPMYRLRYLGTRADTLHTLMRIDLTDIPSGARVEKATLSLWAGAGNASTTLLVYKLLRAWEEKEATWMEARSGEPWDVPGILGGHDVSPAPITTARIHRPYRWVHIDITHLVQEWVNHPDQNFGLLLTGKEPGVEYHFLSKDFPLAKFRPHLDISYRLPAPTPTPTSTTVPIPTPSPTATPSPAPTPMFISPLSPPPTFDLIIVTPTPTPSSSSHESRDKVKRPIVLLTENGEST